MQYEVVADELRAHASHLDGLKDRLDTALSAAHTVSMSDKAFGLLCSFLPPVIDPMEHKGIDALRSAVDGVRVTADKVRATANQYEHNDKTAADTLQRIQRST